MYVCMYVFMYVCMYACMYVCICMYIYIYIYIYVLPKYILTVKLGFQSRSPHSLLMAKTELQKSGIG